MKLKQESRWGEMVQALSSKSLLFGALFVVLFSFIAGMLFYRSGAASRLSSWLRRVPESDLVVQSLDELSQVIEEERLLYASNGLPNVFLDVPFDSMLALEDKRAEALELGVL